MTISKRFVACRAFTEDLCSPLYTEDYLPQPVDFVSPPKWHLAHTTWFFEEFILNVYAKKYQQFHPSYSFLFNSYYNHIGERTLRAKRGDLSRPTVDEVYQYRKHVTDHIALLLEIEPQNAELNDLIELGINHEQQHQELLITDLKYTLSLNPLYPTYKEGYSMVDDQSVGEEFIDIGEGNYVIGSNGDGEFVFDNEIGQHKVWLNSYSISSELVTNGDYLAFVESGGYQDFRYWHDEAFAWILDNNIDSPLYWRFIDGKWYQYTLGGLVNLDLNARLAHISFYEANAFAFWKGMRLPTEAEWEVASNKFEWGARWEWTQSAYLPYPAFKIAEGAIGEYNGKFMVNQKVLRGASNATAVGHSRKTYRNFFHPHHRWQLTGIRLVK